MNRYLNNSTSAGEPIQRRPPGGGGGGGDSFMAFSIGGEWVYNGDSWRGIVDTYNIQQTAHAAIFGGRTFPFDLHSDGVGVWSFDKKFGHVVPSNGEIVSIQGLMKNEMATQKIAFGVLVMRLNEVSGLMETVDAVHVEAEITNNKAGEFDLDLETPIAVQKNDSLVYVTACEITTGTTVRLKGSFTVQVKKT